MLHKHPFRFRKAVGSGQLVALCIGNRLSIWLLQSFAYSTCKVSHGGARGSMTRANKDRRHVFLLIDGIADTNQTPLQTARTPCMDAIAKAGACGVMDPVEPGLACGSDTAHMSILGYPPRIHYRGRGAFESMGAGIDMKRGDIAFKSNFATLDDDRFTVRKRRASRKFEHLGPELCAYLTDYGLLHDAYPECSVLFKYSTEHRCGVRLRGPNLSDYITGTDPLKDNLPLVECKPTVTADSPHYADALRTSQIVNELSRMVTKALLEHPKTATRENKANVVLFRGAGVRIEVPSFENQTHLRGFMIAPTAIINGLGQCLGMQALRCEGATGDYYTSFEAKAKCALEAMTRMEENGSEPTASFHFGFVHVKAIDDAGHDGEGELKTQLLARVDAELLRPLLEGLGAFERENENVEFSICVSGDHSTPVAEGDHSFEPVPFAICRVSDALNALQSLPESVSSSDSSNNSSCSGRESGNGAVELEFDSVEAFDELSCTAGCLGRFPGIETMGIIERFMKL